MIIAESSPYKNVCSLISLVNNDFQINKWTLILPRMKGYALSILNITYLRYNIIKVLSFINYFFPETRNYLTAIKR